MMQAVYWCEADVEQIQSLAESAYDGLYAAQQEAGRMREHIVNAMGAPSLSDPCYGAFGRLLGRLDRLGGLLDKRTNDARNADARAGMTGCDQFGRLEGGYLDAGSAKQDLERLNAIAGGAADALAEYARELNGLIDSCNAAGRPPVATPRGRRRSTKITLDGQL